jgi:CBS domain-containing protein
MPKAPDLVSIMTPLPHTIEASHSIHEAKVIMDLEKIRHLPVTSDGRLVGVLSARDLKLAFVLSATGNSSETIQVGDVCNLEAYITEFSTPVDQVLSVMLKRKLGSVLVTREGKLVGIVTTTDICRNYSELLKIMYPDA